MSTSVRIAHRGGGLRMVLTGGALLLASAASLTALLAIAFTATGNLAVAAAYRPGANDGWRQAAVAQAPTRRMAARNDVVASVAAERNWWDQTFEDAEAAGRGREVLKDKLADAAPALGQGPSAPVEVAEAPRVVSPIEPVQLASLTPSTQPVEVAAAEEEAPAPTKSADRAVAIAQPVIVAPIRIVPIPKPRPADFARMAQPAPRVQVASLSPEAPEPEAKPALAYATPELETKSEGPGGFFKNLLDQQRDALLPHRSRGIAIYDIASATVRLPNGEKLEAHSGLAHRQDDPRYVREKNRGPTPPNVYDLRMREARFHGSEAIRLLPRSQKLVFNRDGLLAHPYMYAGGGSRSQSNGCVVFKDYGRFLRAFKAGEIAKLVVVPNMAELPTYMSAL